MARKMMARRGLSLRMAAAWCLALAGCSPSGQSDWHGYYYRDLLSNAPAQLSGPYASAGQCVASLRGLMQRAPMNAGFACARRCTTVQRSAAQGITADCAEVAR